MRAVCLGIALLSVALPAYADVVQLQAIASQPAGWSSSLIFAKADPNVGPLTSVTLGLTGTLGGTLQIENRDTSAVSAGTFVLGTVAARQPSGQAFVSAQPTAGGNVALGAFDGKIDFAGTSGRTIALSATDTQSQTLNVGSVLTTGLGSASRFVGKGHVAIPVSARVSSQITAGGNITARVMPTSGASGTLTYTQAAPGINNAWSATGETATTIAYFNAPIGSTVRLRTTATQTAAVAEQATGWSEGVKFGSFDPKLGALWSINLALDMPTALTQSAENLSARAGGVSYDQTTTLALSMINGGALIETSYEAKGAFALGAFDGSENGAGTSGGTHASGGRSKIFGKLQDVSNFVVFSTPGGVDLLLASTGKSDIWGANAFWASLGALAGADISLSYTYVMPSSSPTGASLVAEPGDTMLFIAALGSLGLAARARRRG